MMVRFVCGNCGQKFKAAEEYAGQASQCPACGVMVQIPVPEPPVAAVETPPAPVPPGEPEEKLDILKFKPVFKKNEPPPAQNVWKPEPSSAPGNIPVIESTPVPEAPKLKMKPRINPELNNNALPASLDNSSSFVFTPTFQATVSKPEIKQPVSDNAPAGGIKMPPLMKAPAAAPKQAFPVGFTVVKPKLPPGLSLVEEDES